MKTKILFRIYRYIAVLLILSFGLIQHVQAYSGKDPRNGDDHPTKGTIRALVVFAEVTGDPNYNISTWPWEAGQMPANAGELFDVNLLTFGGGVIGPAYGPISPTVSAKPTKRITSFYYDASFGDLVLLGDYYPELVQIPYSLIKYTNGLYNYNQLVLNVLSSKQNLKSKTGLRIPQDFDRWTPTGSYLEKNQHPDGKIDNLIIIWRVNSYLTTVNGSGKSGGGCSSSDGKLQSNFTQDMYVSDFVGNTILPHEFSHTLLGGNEFHNGPANTGERHFMTDVGGYGLLEGDGCNLRSCNAWDRRRLGWKYAAGLPDIHARSTDNQDVSGEIVYHKPTAAELQANTAPSTQEYVLRDFMTTGDALRIPLPYLEQGGSSVEPQWIWIENHAKDTGLLYYSDWRPCPLGVRINLQIGSDYYGCPMRTNYYVPLNRFGRWDFNVVKNFVSNAPNRSIVIPPYIPELDTSTNADLGTLSTSYQYRAYTTSEKSNAFTGNFLLEQLNFDANADGMLQDKEVFMMRYVYKDYVSTGADYPYYGSIYDAFQVGDVLSMGTNPATTPWLTHDSETGENTCTPITTSDNRTIYLNGIKIAITEKRADGSVVVAVTQGYYTIDKDQRWCGDIVSNEKISLNAGRTINLALGETPVVKTNPIVIGGKRFYTEPTVLTCRSSSVLSLSMNSQIVVDSLCALVLQKGSILKKNGSFGQAEIRIKRGGTLIVESGAMLPNTGVRFVLEEGSYACIGSSIPNCVNDGANIGVHPYVQQKKGLTCRRKISTFSAPQKKGGDTAQVYQSFFEGDPVYYQTWERYEYKWYGGATIHAHGLEGDTMVDGVVYHRLKVGRTGAYHREMPEFWVRESERHDKVWVRMPWDAEGRDIPVVDMDLEAGDLFPVSTYPDTVYYEVDSVYWVEHAGGLLKHIRLKPTGDNAWTKAMELLYVTPWNANALCDWHSRHLEFIEGIGSNLGFVYPRLGLPIDNTDSLWEPLHGNYFANVYAGPNPDYEDLYLYDYIVCMDRNDTLFYTHPNMDCTTCMDEYMWIESLMYDEPDPNSPTQPRPANESLRSMSRYLRLTPNPAREEVSLRWAAESPVGGPCRIELHTLQGLKLRTFVTDRWPYTLRVSDLPSGTYVLRVVPQDASAAWQATVRLTRL